MHLLRRVELRSRVVRANARRRFRRSRWGLRVATRRVLGLPPPEAVAKIMFEFARTRRQAFVVQVGAHDGRQYDPIRRYIKTKRWKGILIEPLPFVFEKLRANYADVEDLILENVAIAPVNGHRDLYFLRPTSERGLPPWYSALATFRKDVLLAHRDSIPDIDDRLQSVRVPCLTFETLCSKHGVEHIDVIQIDAEGFDWEIIKLIDLDRHQPTIVQFEELHMDADERRAARALLADHGFEALGNGMDCLCLAPGRLGAGDERLARVWQQLTRSSAPA